MPSYKPDGFTAVSPYLIVDDPAAAIAFMESLFGATVNDLHKDGERIAHASLDLDGSIIMVGGAMEGWPAMPAHIHVYVADVDAAYAKALELGAASVQEPAQKGDPDKRGGVKDTTGTTWWLATHNG